jgi:hypothetical protein
VKVVAASACHTTGQVENVSSMPSTTRPGREDA